MFQLKIVTPEKVFDLVEVSILNLVTINGQIGLLANHMPYISKLIPSQMNYVDKQGQRHFLSIGSGFVSFTNNVATIAIDYCHEN